MTRALPLGEIADFVSGGTPSKGNPTYWGGDIPWVSAKDMKWDFIYDSEDHITPAGAAKGTRMLPEGATLMLVRGMTLHKYVPICLTEKKVTINQDVKGLIAKREVRPKFLFYSLKALHSRIHQLVDSAGHGTGRLNTEQLKRIKILVPNLDSQDRILDLVSPFDEKIELSRRLNENLDKLTRTIFKSWFVDFEPVREKSSGRKPPGLDDDVFQLFPGSFRKEGDEDLPTGWVREPLSIVADFQEGPGILAKDFTASGIPLIRLEGLKNGGSLLNGCDFLSSERVKAKWDHFRLKRGDILLSTSATLGRIAEVTDEAAGSIAYTGIIRFRADPTRIDQRYLKHCLASSTFQAQIEAMGVGSVLRHFGPTHLKHMKVLVPSLELQQRFGEFVAPMDEIKARNLKEASTLGLTRDLILARLLSEEGDS